MANRACLVWITLLGAIESLDILTTGMGRALGAMESMPISAAVINEGGMLLFIVVKVALVIAVASAVLLTLGRHVAVLWEEGGHPLAAQVGRLCLYLDRPPLITSVPKFALARIYRLLVAHMAFAPYEARPAPWRVRLRLVGLVSRQLASSSAVRIVRDDIGGTDRFGEQADVCRAANVLNRAYFADDLIEIMARNLLRFPAQRRKEIIRPLILA